MRGRISKPKASEADPTFYYQAEDLYIGSRVEFNKYKFLLMDADEYALRYMEKHKQQVRRVNQLLLPRSKLHLIIVFFLFFFLQFPHSNISLILSKLRGPASAHITHVKAAFSSADSDNTGTLLFDQFW